MILFLSCSRSFMNRRSRLFFLFDLFHFRATLRNGFSPLFLLFLASTGSGRFGLRNTTVYITDILFYFDFYLIYCISCIGPHIFNLFFQLTRSVYHSVFGISYCTDGLTDTFSKCCFFVSVWSGVICLCPCRTPRTRLSFFTCHNGRPSP